MKNTKNTNNAFIKIPNKIVGNLKEYHCSLYVYLLYLCTVQNTDKIKVKYDTCKNQIGAAFKGTVCDEMHYLQEQGYVKIENNYSFHGLQTCNTITVIGFNPQQDYFLLPAEHMELQLPPVAFELMLCLYMLAYQDSYCYPSYKQIFKVCHLGYGSISKGYKILEEKGVIKKENYTRRDSSYGHNRYFLVKKIEKLVGKENAACFFAWIRKQKVLCFEVWQIIKEVLKGNTYILEEICRQEEACSMTDDCYTEAAPFVPKAASGIGDFFHQKISRIHDGIRHFFGNFPRFVRGVLFQN